MESILHPLYSCCVGNEDVLTGLSNGRISSGRKSKYGESLLSSTSFNLDAGPLRVPLTRWYASRPCLIVIFGSPRPVKCGIKPVPEEKFICSDKVVRNDTS